MKNDTFTVIPQNMREYQMSIREADNENDLYREAEREALKESEISVDQLDRYMEASDMFKAGWEAAVRCLDDEPVAAPLPAAPAPTDPQTKQSLENIEQLAVELPPLPFLPSHPDPHTYHWTVREAQTIAEYGKSCARAALAARQVGAPDTVRDAARYRYLMRQMPCNIADLFGDCVAFDEVDDEIDAAIAQEKAP